MLSILIPSMNRCELLKQTVQSFLDTCPVENVQFSIVIDVDEHSVEEIIKLLKQYNANFVIDYSLKKRGALDSWNVALKISSGELVLIIGDDHKAHPGWYEKAIAAHAGLGNYGVVGLNDLMHDGSQTTATTLLVDREFIKREFGGRITYPCYRYYCQDSELNERAKRTGKFVWLSDAVVEHIHAANGKRLMDEHDRNRVESGFTEEDEQTYDERKAAGFPDIFERII